MLTEEKKYIDATVSIRIAEPSSTNTQPRLNGFEPGQTAPVFKSLFEFAANSPATYAERFPRLMVCAVAASVILTAITAEIECLHAMGYYWQ